MDVIEGEPKPIEQMTPQEAQARLNALIGQYADGEKGLTATYTRGLGHYTSGHRDTPEAGLYIEVDQVQRVISGGLDLPTHSSSPLGSTALRFL